MNMTGVWWGKLREPLIKVGGDVERINKIRY